MRFQAQSEVNDLSLFKQTEEEEKNESNSKRDNHINCMYVTVGKPNGL